MWRDHSACVRLKKRFESHLVVITTVVRPKTKVDVEGGKKDGKKWDVNPDVLMAEMFAATGCHRHAHRGQSADQGATINQRTAAVQFHLEVEFHLIDQCC